MGQGTSNPSNSLQSDPANKPSKIYLSSSLDGALRQGEILSELVQVKIKLERILSESDYQGIDLIHQLAIIVTQDCDLEQDYKARFIGSAGKHRLLPNILFCEAEFADGFRNGHKDEKLSEDKRERSRLINSNGWKIIQQNKDERFHFLQKIPKEDDSLGKGIDELCVEFKRYFTIPTDEVYHRIKVGNTIRRCRLASPYLEHLSVRYHYYHFRVALPEDHASE